jgi:hypothetical protein
LWVNFCRRITGVCSLAWPGQAGPYTSRRPQTGEQIGAASRAKSTQARGPDARPGGQRHVRLKATRLPWRSRCNGPLCCFSDPESCAAWHGQNPTSTPGFGRFQTPAQRRAAAARTTVNPTSLPWFTRR